jgi:hypothetical protein
MITVAHGARTELQVGSTSIRLDGDSALEVLALDDDRLALRLHYGSASIRIISREALAGFELSTPEGRVRMQEPGRLRVDSGRRNDTTSVTVFDGLALVENGGASITVRPGKRAELQDDDVRTVAAHRDGFDDWALARDRALDAPTATRYVSTDMTGYPDLDRYGSWRTDPEYGALWTPAMLPPGWVPYSDGSWVWMGDWGWTWVDNSPWGYAPFHYGRWVYLNHRWHWTPGHHRERRPVWSPALVGWVGGSGWNVGFRLNNRHQPMPARGWYPLSPHERYVPTYHLSEERVRRLNGDVRPDFRHRWEEQRRAGLTVVPQEHFGQRGQVVVPRVAHSQVPAQALASVTASAPPAAPAGARDWRQQQRQGAERNEQMAQWRDRGEHRGDDHDRGDGRDGRRGDERGRDQGPRPQVLTAPPAVQSQVIPPHREPPQPVSAASPPPVLTPQGGIQAAPQPVIPEHRQPPQPVTVLSAPPVFPGQQQQPVPTERQQWRQEHRERPNGDRWEHRNPDPAPAAAPAPQPAQPPAERFERQQRPEAGFERPHRPEAGFERPQRPESGFERHGREITAAPPASAPQAAPPRPAPVSQPAPPPVPLVRQMQPPPAAQSGPAPAAAPAPGPVHHGRDRSREDQARPQERQL